VDCVRMEKSTFLDAQVQSAITARFMPVQVDLTDPNNADRKALKKRYGVYGPPAMLFIDTNGKLLESKSFYGYKDATEFLAHLNSI
jgi:thiol:disulfide interchange protein DsbD